jgi:hypothetical protein
VQIARASGLAHKEREVRQGRRQRQHLSHIPCSLQQEAASGRHDQVVVNEALGKVMFQCLWNKVAGQLTSYQCGDKVHLSWAASPPSDCLKPDCQIKS